MLNSGTSLLSKLTVRHTLYEGGDENFTSMIKDTCRAHFDFYLNHFFGDVENRSITSDVRCNSLLVNLFNFFSIWLRKAFSFLTSLAICLCRPTSPVFRFFFASGLGHRAYEHLIFLPKILLFSDRGCYSYHNRDLNTCGKVFSNRLVNCDSCKRNFCTEKISLVHERTFAAVGFSAST